MVPDETYVILSAQTTNLSECTIDKRCNDYELDLILYIQESRAVLMKSTCVVEAGLAQVPRRTTNGSHRASRFPPPALL